MSEAGCGSSERQLASIGTFPRRGRFFPASRLGVDADVPNAVRFEHSGVNLVRRSAFLLAPIVLLVSAIPAAASAPTTALLRASPQMARPDWLAQSDDEGDAPLSFDRLTQALKESVEGPELYGLRVTSSPHYAGDRRLFATVSPNGDHLRDKVTVHFHLEQPANVTMTVMVCSKHSKTIWRTKDSLPAGDDKLVWAPAPNTLPRTYLLLLTATANGIRHAYGNPDYRLARLDPAPAVRVQGVDAGFGARSYSPGARARLRIATDAPSFTLQFFQAGPESQPTEGYSMEGEPVSDPKYFNWSAHRDAPGSIVAHIGNWPNGIYFAELTTADDRVGYAPFVVRPPVYGRNRIAYIVRTNTWEAYNHQDVNGDGWGDTWYAANAIRNVGLARHYIGLGAPPKWRAFDLTPLHWLYRTDKKVDFLSDDDLEAVKTARTLANRYDLIVFPGHEEYVTRHMYDLIEGYRNRGGNLMFLGATNFLWRVERHGNRITRAAEWRWLGRPESSLIGVQYRGNDEGEHRGPYTLTPSGRSSWEFEGVDQTALPLWRWFGIEFDMTTSVSPRGIHVLAQVNPHMPNPRLRGEMTYYTRGRAKVFAAGVLNFPGSVYYPAYRQVLENVWARLVEP